MPSEPRPAASTFTIRQLCREFKCTARALRFYEAKGLLSPARDGQNRIYSIRDRARLQLILRGKRVNLSLAEIRDILDLYDKNDDGAAQDAAALRTFRERLVALERQRQDLDQAIAILRGASERIERKLIATRPELLAQARDRTDRAA